MKYLETLITQISLTREEEREINIPKYKMLFENNSYYSLMITTERKKLIEERKKYDSDMNFYKGIAIDFAKEYIPKIIDDYGDKLDDETIEKLKNIVRGDGLKIFMPREAISKGYLSLSKNGNPTGDDGAFAREELGIIGFTPESESSKLDLSGKTQNELNEIVINNALKMKGIMIHETFHLLINVMKKEHFFWKEKGIEKSQLTSGGFILNEGLVEKYATDFSLRHNFIHNPALDYFHYISLCNAMEQIIGKDELERISFHSNYLELLDSTLNIKQKQLYKFHERKKYLEKIGITTDVQIIFPTDELSQTFSFKQKNS